ncbi:MAG: heme-copper oxidase subunit III [Actinomycetota bacterium]|nr:heme-copper oxidase subunit III [Actinomycetota bacterium]
MTQLEAHSERRPSAHRRPRVSPSLLGMILFIASEVMFFGGLFGAYFNIRAGFGEWPPAGTPEIEIVVTIALTVVLLSSSVTQHLAVAAIKRDDPRGLVRWIGITVCLGLAFLAGQAYEYSTLGFGPADNVFTTLFFTITGFHGFHVAAGVVILILVMLRANRFSAEHHGHVEAATYYWHFVDAVWLFVFTALYLLTQ